MKRPGAFVPAWRNIPKSHSSSILEVESAPTASSWSKNKHAIGNGKDLFSLLKYLQSLERVISITASACWVFFPDLTQVEGIRAVGIPHCVTLAQALSIGGRVSLALNTKRKAGESNKVAAQVTGIGCEGSEHLQCKQNTLHTQFAE